MLSKLYTFTCYRNAELLVKIHWQVNPGFTLLILSVFIGKEERFFFLKKKGSNQADKGEVSLYPGSDGDSLTHIGE